MASENKVKLITTASLVGFVGLIFIFRNYLIVTLGILFVSVVFYIFLFRWKEEGFFKAFGKFILNMVGIFK